MAVAAVAVLVLGLFLWNRGDSPPESLGLGEYEEMVEAGEVETAEIRDQSNVVVGELTDGTDYEVDYPNRYTADLTAVLLDNGVDPETDSESQSIWVTLLFQLLPVLLIVGVFLFFLSSMQGGGRGVMKFGKSKARKAGDEPDVTFADVAGADEAVEELQEIKDFLENPDRFHAVGAKIPKGVLLFGPPGTGKTLLARAVAGEAGRPFYSISGSDFVEMFVGVGASRVRDLFKQAKAHAPAIVFVDEIDAVGRHRGAGVGGGHDEREQTLNQMLVEMDGFDSDTGVILIAATNRPDILDPALLRPGRFDRQIVVDRPDLAGRQQILEVHARGKPLGPDVDLSVVARRTPGFTGADLANLLNEAALLTARRDLLSIDRSTIDEAIDRVMAGPERKSQVMTEREKRVIAYHESGHALVGHLLPNTDPIHKVSIVARGRALGWTLSVPEEERRLRTQSELNDRMAMILGGRTAEELTFGEPTTGAQDDIERATEIARAMVTEFGMSALGPQQLGNSGGEVFMGKEMNHRPSYSDEIGAAVDREVRRLLDEAHDEAREVLSLHRATLDQLADALVEHETLDEPKLEAILGDLEPWEGSTSEVVDRGDTRSGSRTTPEPEPHNHVTRADGHPTDPDSGDTGRRRF